MDEKKLQERLTNITAMLSDLRDDMEYIEVNEEM
jgi:hypothetical protein